jgi:hypothetical protein
MPGELYAIRPRLVNPFMAKNPEGRPRQVVDGVATSVAVSVETLAALRARAKRRGSQVSPSNRDIVATFAASRAKRLPPPSPPSDYRLVPLHVLLEKADLAKIAKLADAENVSVSEAVSRILAAGSAG